MLVLSVALLADLIHNFGDALTEIPLGLAFFLRSLRGERWAGFAVVGTIFVSAVVALVQTTLRFIHPHGLTHLWWLAAAGVIGFVGNEIAAHIRLRAGKRLSSPALVADGDHARTDGFVSLGVLASAGLVALGAQVADPIIGLVITFVILRITWQSWRTVSTTEPGEMVEAPEHHPERRTPKAVLTASPAVASRAAMRPSAAGSSRLRSWPRASSNPRCEVQRVLGRG